MAIKIRLPNGRYIKVETDDPKNAQQKAQSYYDNGGRGFIDATTQNLAQEYDKRFDYDTGVQAPWLRTKLAAMETLGGKERVLEDAVGSDGFTRDSGGSLALTPLGMERLGFDSSGKNIIIDESGFSLNDFVDFAGALGPIAGSIAGSIITRGKLKPTYPGVKNMTLKQLGQISLGTGTGAAAGKYAEEAAEYVSGLQDQGVTDLAKLGATEFAIGAGGEFLFGAAAKAFKAALGQNALAREKVGERSIKEAAAIARGVRDDATGKVYEGATAIAGLESPITGQLQPILEAITKYKGREDNLAKSLIVTLKNLYRKTNDLTADYDVSIDDLRKEGFTDIFSQVESGKLLREGLQESLNKVESKANAASQQVRESANKLLNDFDAFGEPTTSQAGNDIKSFAQGAYSNWEQTSDALYSQIQDFFRVPARIATDTTGPYKGVDVKQFLPTESLTESIEFINAMPIRAAAQKIKDTLLKGVAEDDPLLREINSLAELGGDKGLISLDGLLKIRKDLAAKVRVTGSGNQPAPYASLDSKERVGLLKVVNKIIQDLENGSEIAVGLARTAFDDAVELIRAERKTKGGRMSKAESELIDDLIKRAGNSDKIKSYVQGLRIANNFYSKGMQAFDDVTFKKMLNSARHGGLNVDKVISQLALQKNNGEKIKQLLETFDSGTAGIKGQYDKATGQLVRGADPERVRLGISPDDKKILADIDIKVNEPYFANSDKTLNILQKEFFRNLIKQADPNKPVNYTNLANKINDFGTTTDVIFPNGLKRDLVKTLNDTDKLVNTGSVKELEEVLKKVDSGDEIVSSLKNKLDVESELNSLKQTEIIRRMDKIGTEDLVATLFKKGNADEIRLIRETLGPNSEKFKQFQVGAMNKALSDIINPNEDVVTKLFNEGKFSDLVKDYESVLRETFGEEQFGLMKKAADRIKFAMTAEKKAGGGTLFTQAFVMKYIWNPIGALGRFTPLRVMAWALGQPATMRFLAGDISEKEFIKQAPSLLRDLGYTRPITKSMLTQTLADEFEDSAEEGARYLETEGIDPNLPLGSVELPKQTVNLELPKVQTTTRAPSVAGQQVPASLISDPLTRDLANLLGS